MNPPTQTDTPSKFIVKSSQADMPGSCWGRGNYRNIALIETDGRKDVSMISERARGVRKIHRTLYKVHVGDTVRSEGYRFLSRCIRVAERINRMKGV